MKLYHYVHCPFCVRVRMTLGLLELSYESQVLPYDDEKTPLDLMGKKMLPIFIRDNNASNESLEIMKGLDRENRLSMELLEDNELFSQVETLLSRLGKPIHNLAMPYWMYTKEFNPESRAYFQKKKEAKRGPFNEVARNKEQYLDELKPLLKEVESLIGPFFMKIKDFSVFDIMLASHLWGLYMVPEFQFSPFLHRYLQMVRKVCRFDYHEDFWNGNLGS